MQHEEQEEPGITRSGKDNHAIDLDNNGIDTMQKVDYVHNNPVVSGWVLEPEHYAISSAMDYAGGKGLVKVSIL